MTRDEIKALEYDLNIPNVICLPRIIEHDVQCIWIGATIGDVIRVEKRSTLTGTIICYFFVASFNVDLVESDKSRKAEVEEVNEESSEESDEESEVEGGKGLADLEDVEDIE